VLGARHKGLDADLVHVIQQACVAGVGATHVRPSWCRSESTTRTLVMRTPRKLSRAFANDVRLAQNTTTPGNGDEPGYALTVAANGTISQ
jgi:hypothetical protein